jgi:hypothetical protein
VDRVFHQAQADTYGYLMTLEAARKGIEPKSLFTGLEARAMKYASDELKDWWREHPRMTKTEWAKWSKEEPPDPKDDQMKGV